MKATEKAPETDALRQQWIDARATWEAGKDASRAKIDEWRRHIQERLALPVTPILEQVLEELRAIRDEQKASTAPRTAVRNRALVHAGVVALDGPVTQEEVEAAQQRTRKTEKAIARWNAEWEQLRVEGRGFGPSLAGVRFSRLNAAGIDLRNADLSNHETSPAQHDGVNFSRASLSGANLSGADLSIANLGAAILTDAHLSQANLKSASLAGAVLDKAVLRGARLENADLTGAWLQRADLTGASIRLARLDEARLFGARGVLLDQNHVHRTVFSGPLRLSWAVLSICFRTMSRIMGRPFPTPWTPELPTEDQWTYLRRNYSGASFILTIILIGCFILPHLARALVLSELGRAENATSSLLERATGLDLANAKPPDEQEMVGLEERIRRRIQDAQANLDAAIAALRNVDAAATDLAPNCIQGSLVESRQALARGGERLAGVQRNWEQMLATLAGIRQGKLSLQSARTGKQALTTFHGRSFQSVREARRALSEGARGLVAIQPVCLTPVAWIISREWEAVASSLDGVYTSMDDSGADLARFASGARAVNTFPLWKVLSGLDLVEHDPWQIRWTVLLLTLLSYNLLRGYLILKVVPLREAEDRSWITPSLMDYESLWKWNVAVSYLRWIAIAWAAFEVWSWLQVPITKLW